MQALAGASGEIPSPRKQCQLEITAKPDVLYIYGGINSEGDLFDELYSCSYLFVGRIIARSTLASY